MAEYIEREQLIGSLEDVIADYRDEHTFSTDFAATVVIDILNNIVKCQPAADVEPVRHGRWEPVLEGVWNLPTPVLVGWRCSQCGRTEQEKEPYCNCGARMDEEVKHEN